MGKGGKTLDEMRAENPNFDKDLEITFQLAERGKPKPTPDQKVARWNEIKTFLAGANKQFADLCAPYSQEQKEIEAWLHNFLNENRLKNVKTESGTAYISTLTQPKIADRTAYLDWCLANWDEAGNELLQIGSPQVAAFESYVEENKITPPGTTVTYFERLNIRKS